MSSKFDTRSRWYTVVGDEVLYLKARKQRFNGRLVDGMDRDELLRMVAVGYHERDLLLGLAMTLVEKQTGERPSIQDVLALAESSECLEAFTAVAREVES